MKHEKIAPALLVAHEDYVEDGVEGLGRHVRLLGLAHVDDTPREPESIVFLECLSNASLSGLAKEGVRINQTSGELRTAAVPLSALEALSNHPGIRRVVPSRFLRPSMDLALPACGVPAFRNQHGVDGRGVVVAVIDSGIDPGHSAFNGRISKVWDQSLSGPGPASGAFPYGLEFSSPPFLGTRDTNGHGTHVAGIAAGDDPVFGGVAPGAELLIIKTDFQNAHIADAVVYAFNYARSMGRPAVVNLSLGGHSDAHDGTDPLSRIIDRESGPGRIVCCAAGNEGNDNIHALCVVPPHTTVSARFRVPASGIRNAELNGWYAGAAALEVGVVSPGHFRTPLQAVLAAGNPLRSYTLGDARVRVATPGPNPDNGDHQFLVDMRGPTAGTTVAAGVWKLVMKNPTAQPVTVHVWTLDDQGEQVIFTGQSVNDGFKIGSPGAAAEAITVASYTSRDTWIDAAGNPQQVGLPVGVISDFSSEGPLRSNAQKPDLMAPGAMIVAPRSSFATTRPAEQLSPTFRVMAGTSMATPYISGVVALILQQNPTLTPAAIKQRLFAGCRLIGNAPGVWDPKQGHGLAQL